MTGAACSAAVVAGLALLLGGAPPVTGQTSPDGGRGGDAAPAASAVVPLGAVAVPAPPWRGRSEGVQEEGGSWAWAGATAGAAVGGTATWLGLRLGGSTSLCDRDANQDALSAGQCAALTAAGALVGAGVGWLVGSRFGRGSDDEASSRRRLLFGVAPGGGATVWAQLRL